MRTLRTWLRGIWLLRYPEIVRELGTRRFELLKILELRDRFPTAKISSKVQLLGYESSRIELGTDVTLCGGTILSFGDDTNGRGHIAIGAGTWIGQYNNFRAGGGAIRIGRDCLVSQFCSLVASNHAHACGRRIKTQGINKDRTGIEIGDDVWLGSGCALMPGVKVSDGAIVGTNAVVTKNVPANEIWAGIPARKIAERD